MRKITMIIVVMLFSWSLSAQVNRHTELVDDQKQEANVLKNINYETPVQAFEVNAGYMGRKVGRPATGHNYNTKYLRKKNNNTDVVILSEGFNGGAMPAGWNTEQVTGTSSIISFESASVHPAGFTPSEGTHFVRFNSYDATSGDAIRLRTLATVDLSAYAAANVTFDWTTDNVYTNQDSVAVQYSTDGTTWHSFGVAIRYGAITQWTAQSFNLPAAALSNVYLGLKFTSRWGNDCHLDNFRLVAPTPMAYLSSGVTQNNTDGVIRGAVQQEIIGLQIITDGSLQPFKAKDFVFTTLGTTSLSDITKAQLWYTGTSSAFATTAQVGADITDFGALGSPFTITDSVALQDGTNYFWLTYDVSATATYNNLLDAVCSGVTVQDTVRTPSPTTVVGARKILQPLSGEYTIDNTQPTAGTNFQSFTEAIDVLNMLGNDDTVIFNVVSSQIFTEMPPAITAVGTVTKPIIFKNAGTPGVNNPKITPTGVGTGDYGMYINGSYITIDGIDVECIASNTTNATRLEYGIVVIGNSTTDKANNNKVMNCNVDLNRTYTSSTGIYLQYGDNIQFLNNEIHDVYWGYMTFGDVANRNKNTVIGVVNGGTHAIYNFAGGASFGGGIYFAYEENIQIHGLNIHNEMTTTSTGTLIGIVSHYNATTPDNSIGSIYNNTVWGLTSTVTCHGIRTQGGVTINMFNNKVYDIVSTSTGTTTGVAAGIAMQNTTTCNIYNNLVYDVKAVTGTATTVSAAGIFIPTGANANVYHNTVNFTYAYPSGSTVNNITAALYWAPANANLDLRNNIFVNNVDLTNNSGATTRACAFKTNSTTLTKFLNTSNYNLYYAGTPDAKHLIYADGTNSDQTLAAYQTRMATRDKSAYTENVPFVSATDLHIQTGVPTQVEKGGSLIAMVPQDFDGDVRNAKSDIGADEGDFIMLDLNPPAITYTALQNSSSTTTRALSNVIVEDFKSGVHAAPRVYYKKSTDPNDITGWKFVAASNATSPFSFTIDYSLIGGVVVGDIIQYFVVAQDSATTPNVGINAGTFATQPASVDLTATAFPIGGTLNSYNIAAALNDTLYVGPGQTYTSLTANTTEGLFNAINGGVLTGNTVVYVTGNTTETGAVALNQITYEGAGLENATLTITVPDTTTQIKVVEGAFNGNLIRLNGADRVIFDGINQFLLLRNTSSTPASALATVYFDNNAIDNIIDNCILENNTTATTTGIIAFSNSGNMNNKIQNCLLRDATAGTTGRPAYSIYLANNDGNNNILIKNNVIKNFNANGISLRGNNISIVGNEFYHDNPSSASSVYAIYIAQVTQANIIGNYFHDLAGIGTSAIYGIYYSGASGVNMNVDVINNIIHLEPTTTGIVRGIDYYGYSANSMQILNNTVYIGGTVASGTNNTAAILKRDATTNFRASNNIVVNARSNSGATASHYAINITTTTSTTFTMDNNNYLVTGTGGVLGYWTANRATLAAFQAASGKDAHSYNVDPYFASLVAPYDFTPANDTLSYTAVPHALVTTDINGDPRHSLYPSMGAIEYDPAGLPTIDTLYPSIGNEGTVVTIEGTNLYGVTDIELGALIGTDIVGVNASEATFEAPAGDGTFAITATIKGGANATSTDLFVLDNTAPIVDVARGIGQADTTTIPNIHFVVTFNEAVTGFDNDITDVVVTGTAFIGPAASASIVATADPSIYDLYITGMNNAGTVVVEIPAAAAMDLAGNGNLEPSTYTDNDVFFQATGVVITLAAGQNNPTNLDTVYYLATFGDTVSGFGDEAGDVVVSGTAGANSYFINTTDSVEFVIGVTGHSVSGTIIITIPANAAVNKLTGVGTLASINTNNTINYDLAPPQLTFVSISSNGTNPSWAKVGSVVTVSFTANEQLGSLPLVTILDSAANVTNTSGNNYVATYTIVATDNEGLVTFSIVCEDLLGNIAAPVSTTTNSTSVTIDKTAPTVAVSTSATSPVYGPFTITVTFSEEVSGFVASDIVVTNGTASNVTTSNNIVYTATITPTAAGTVSATINADAAFDLAGNGNTAAPAPVSLNYVVLDITFTVTSNGTSPVSGALVTIASLGNQTTNASGVAVFASVAPNTYSYTITKTGYVTQTGNVTVTTTSQSVNVTMPPAFVLNEIYNNGGFITNPGAGAGGANVSALHSSMGTLGFGVNGATGYRVADNANLHNDTTYVVRQIKVFGYQTNSTTTSTFTGINFKVWNGKPSAGGTVVYNYSTSNMLTTTAWTGIYRTSGSDLTNTARPVMEIIATLPADDSMVLVGTTDYWIDWSLTGSLASGPWANPLAQVGVTTTGDAIQYNGTAWSNLKDSTAPTAVYPQGLPFKLYGTKVYTPAPTPTLNATPTTLAFGNQVIGTTSAAQTYTLTGSNLTANVTVTAPAGYQVSLNGTSFATSQVVTPASGSVNQTIHVRFAPTAAQAYNGNVTNASTGATTVNVAVTGMGEVGITELGTINVSIYPNPVKEKLFVNAGERIESVRVLNLLGETVYTAKVNDVTTEINTSTFAEGSYVIMVISNNGQAMRKFQVVK